MGRGLTAHVYVPTHPQKGILEQDTGRERLVPTCRNLMKTAETPVLVDFQMAV